MKNQIVKLADGSSLHFKGWQYSRGAGRCAVVVHSWKTGYQTLLLEESRWQRMQQSKKGGAA